jgi:FAD/FMN-containing dehydrogenase
LPGKRQWIVPFNMPEFVLNRTAVSLFNTFLFRKQRNEDNVIEDSDTYFYPLDVVRNWNLLYGRRGFIQYQFTVPTAARSTLVDIMDAVANGRYPSYLGVLKKLGAANDGMLSFPFEGFTLTLDIAVRDGLQEFIQGLTERVVESGGRIYLAKDAMMNPESFRAMYPRFEEFLSVKQKLDPDGLLSSDLSRRVGLTPAESRHE